MSDPVDPRPAIEESCKGHCQKYLKELEACTERVNKIIAEAKPGDEVQAHCTGQYFDFWHCIDHCAAPKLFAKLK
ncbi:hypothetical protein GUITHDRAFT_91152 [Guillardia theta CCMP2712]|uniref:Cytochrome b-c1 complex subunit 6 n=1 Tax=Guillardia theta (strain CCMP2712) TaxID=905079 RepID=L1I7I4_GUITC|nr:hypothetical protein GUITHDRAFT_91152 [Guillardia theta CCMP2712]EKX31795.1 hypothetical protein GUITHDRAFT_91152 [Guillardia theta CCMP2712]|eukprot:XP_005818775.1 hypothetical protein GUITHDRAFT_91152 [Guillardia theta CCMP2712]